METLGSLDQADDLALALLDPDNPPHQIPASASSDPQHYAQVHVTRAGAVAGPGRRFLGHRHPCPGEDRVTHVCQRDGHAVGDELTLRQDLDDATGGPPLRWQQGCQVLG